jgi:hypothetical protein
MSPTGVAGSKNPDVIIIICRIDKNYPLPPDGKILLQPILNQQDERNNRLIDRKYFGSLVISRSVYMGCKIGSV